MSKVKNSKTEGLKFCLRLFQNFFTPLEVENKKLYRLKKYFDDQFEYIELKFLLGMVRDTYNMDDNDLQNYLKCAVDHYFVNDVMRKYVLKHLTVENGYIERILPEQGVTLSTPFYHKGMSDLNNFSVSFYYKSGMIHVGIQAREDGSIGMHGIRITFSSAAAQQFSDLPKMIFDSVHTVGFMDKLNIFSLEKSVYPL